MEDMPVQEKRKELKQELLREILSMREIPTLPTVMQKILETISDEKSSPQELTRILESDPAISTSVLRLANSAFYGLSNNVDSIQRAVVLIGFDAVEMLALATSVIGAFSEHEPHGFDADDFWMHALGTAKASQMVALDVGEKDSAEMCFTAGLLHDIGKYLSALALPEKYARLLAGAREQEVPVHVMEKRLMGVDHSYVAGWVTAKWLFPAVIVETLRYQFQPRSAWPDVCKTELEIVLLGEKISKAAAYGFAGDPNEGLSVSDVPTDMGIKFEEALEMVGELESMKSETREVLNLLG
ncbi:MAG: HDOD domain-containing protein [Candidatus Sumerlaeota bacterium]